MTERNLSIAVSRLNGAGRPAEARLRDLRVSKTEIKRIHPREAEQVARIRAYKVECGGRTYRIYRGDMHRHTDISQDGVGDGSLMDLHRYALDAAAFDFIVVTDHNMGGDKEYPWWRTQKANDLYTLPNVFISMYGYERSVPYPNGHRNVLWAERGHRTLPLPRRGIPKQMAEDTGKVYDYLRRTGGICTLAHLRDRSGHQLGRARRQTRARRRAVPGIRLVLRSSRRPAGHQRQKRSRSWTFQARRLRVAGPGQGLSSRLPGVERSRFDAHQLRLHSRRGIQPQGTDRGAARSVTATPPRTTSCSTCAWTPPSWATRSAPPSRRWTWSSSAPAPLDRVEVLRDGEVVHTHRPEKDECGSEVPLGRRGAEEGGQGELLLCAGRAEE